MAFNPSALPSRRAAASDEGAIIRMAQKARELRARGHDVVSLTVGEPDFDTPEHIQAAATAAMKAGHTHYAPVPGIPELREAVAAKLNRENGLAYGPSNVVMANGVKQAIANAMLALIEPGDEVILLAPYWVSYALLVQLAGGIPVVLEAGVEEAYKVPAPRIAAALSPRTKLIVLNSPCNPTGAVWTRLELEAIAAAVARHPTTMVLSDEIYEYILFDGEMISFGALPGMLERTITVNGFSKGFAMTGWRLGYGAAPEPVARAMARMQSHVSAGANCFVQHAAVAALAGPRDSVDRMRERYRHRRDLVSEGLKTIPGLRLAEIPATFYAFPDVGAFLGRKAGNHAVDTVDRLCDWLLEEHGVATVPGTAFGAPNCIRLSFATGEEALSEGLSRLAAAFRRLAE